MEFRKMVTITRYTRQQKKHWCIEQSFGLCGRGRGWDDLGEWHWNVYNIIYETSSPVQVRCMILDAWGWCPGTPQRDGMGREEGGGFRMGNTCIPVTDSFWYMAKPIQYCKVKLNKIKKKKKRKPSYQKNQTNFLANSVIIFSCVLFIKCIPNYFGRASLFLILKNTKIYHFNHIVQWH